MKDIWHNPTDQPYLHASGLTMACLVTRVLSSLVVAPRLIFDDCVDKIDPPTMDGCSVVAECPVQRVTSTTTRAIPTSKKESMKE